MFNGAYWTIPYGGICNPAIAFGIYMGSVVVDNQAGPASKWLWLYPVMPFAGSVLALMFFELVYRKTTEVISEAKAYQDGGEHDSIDDHHSGEGE